MSRSCKIPARPKARHLGAVAVAVAVLAAPALVAAPTTAAPSGAALTPAAFAPAAPQKSAFSMSLTLRSVTAYPGAERIGSLVVSQGSVNDTSTGARGSFTGVATVVAPDGSRRDLRDERVTVRLGGGELHAQTIASAPRGERPDVALIMPIVGGTGEYRAARGTMTMIPAGRTYILAVDLLRVTASQTLRVGLDRPVEVRAESTAASGIGSTVVRTAEVRGGGQFRAVLTRIERGAAVVTQAVDAGLVLPRGTLQLRAQVTAPRRGGAETGRYAVLGGTGSYAGMRGEARFTPARTGARLELTLVKVAGGPTEQLLWTETDRRPEVVATTGGTYLSDAGRLNGKGPDGRLSGKFLLGMRTLTAAADTPGAPALADTAVTVVEHEIPGGTVLVAGTTASDAAPLLRPIVGGTGEYAGAIGASELVRLREGVYRLTVSVWR